VILTFVPAPVLFVTRPRLFVQRRGVSSQFVWAARAVAPSCALKKKAGAAEKLEPRREYF
jgi:hypothetical protein